jgi:hypothetical protein
MEEPEQVVREIHMSDLSRTVSHSLSLAHQPYDYRVLKDNEMRLLELSPELDVQDEQAPVSYRLNHYPIDAEVAYDALSYTWGIEQTGKVIRVDGRILKVKPNLDAALRQFRRNQGKHNRGIWIDAICLYVD